MRKLTRNDLGETTPKRFWKYVVKTDNCWEWIGNRLPERANQLGGISLGYGRLLNRHPERGQVDEYAHRIAYVMMVGDIPEGMHVRHSCDNPKCVNPAHLSLGTPSENARDREHRQRSPGRISAQRRELIARDYAAGMRVADIFAKHRANTQSLYRILDEFGIPRRMSRP